MHTDRIVQKIEALLRKGHEAYNNNTSEREACISRAKKLAEKYNISIEEPVKPKKTKKPVEPKKSKRPKEPKKEKKTKKADAKEVKWDITFEEFTDKIRLNHNGNYVFVYHHIVITFKKNYNSERWSFIGNDGEWHNNFKFKNIFRRGYKHYKYLVELYT
jgi:hypothetical protein